MIKVCLDTNVLISAALFDGKPEEILRLVKDGKLTFIISPAILLELARILVDKFQRDIEEAMIYVKLLYDFAKVVRPKKKLRVVKHDSDNRILECAVEDNVDFIVTGDKKHLLPLKGFKNISIITPQEFLKRFTTKN